MTKSPIIFRASSILIICAFFLPVSNCSSSDTEVDAVLLNKDIYIEVFTYQMNDDRQLNYNYYLGLDLKDDVQEEIRTELESRGFSFGDASEFPGNPGVDQNVLFWLSKKVTWVDENECTISGERYINGLNSRGYKYVLRKDEAGKWSIVERTLMSEA